MARLAAQLTKAWNAHDPQAVAALCAMDYEGENVGEAAPHRGPTAWATVRRRWAAGDEIRLAFEQPIMLRRAGPRVRGHAGKVALTRGPLVYCLESPDNPGVDLFAAQIDPASLRADPVPGLLGGIVALRGQTPTGRPVTAIPYALWANRGASQMAVWISVPDQ